MKPISPFGLPVGLSVGFWALVGVIRYIVEEKLGRKFSTDVTNQYKASEIAAVLPAHNEELVIGKCVQAIKQSLSPDQIYVISDGSSDMTAERAREEDCVVEELNPGLGKAKAIIHAVEKYRLFERYNFIFIVDSDTNVDENFVPRALTLFNDPEISVVFARPMIRWEQHIVPRLSYYFIGYRERLNRILWNFMMYGQTWKYTNMSYVIPGFCTIYRSSILRRLEIDTPGLLIEDFNLAFQLHRRKLGKIGHTFGLWGWDQHPDNLPDYWKQVRRWNIGFFQTVKVNGFWPSFFWLTLAVFTMEVFLHSIFLLVLPLWFVSLFVQDIPFFSSATTYIQSRVPISPFHLFFAVFVYDYLLSVVIGLVNKKPQLLFYGLFFFIMHYITSLILLTSVVPGFMTSSEGRWISPKRQEV